MTACEPSQIRGNIAALVPELTLQAYVNLQCIIGHGGQLAISALPREALINDK